MDRTGDRPNLFWHFPIVLGSIVLVAASMVRGSAGWRKRDPDPSNVTVQPA